MIYPQTTCINTCSKILFCRIPKNTAFRVVDPPTNQRAELAAFMHVLRTEDRPFCVNTDSRYVHDGYTSWRHSWRAQAFFKHPLDAELRAHSDLWREVGILLARRPPGSVKTQWKKDHPLDFHVEQGLTTRVDAWGNTAADGLATMAMHHHRTGQAPLTWPRDSAILRRTKH